MCGSNVQFQEADSPVVPLIKERIEPVWVTLWTEEAVCWGWKFCVVCQRDLAAELDVEGCSRGLCVRVRRISWKTSGSNFNGSVSRGELEDDIELKQKCQCETYE